MLDYSPIGVGAKPNMEVIHVGPRPRVFGLTHLIKRKAPSRYGGSMLSHLMASIFFPQKYAPRYLLCETKVLLV